MFMKHLLYDINNYFVYLPFIAFIVLSLFVLAVRVPLSGILIRASLYKLKKKNPQRYTAVKMAVKKPLGLFLAAVLVYALYSLSDTVIHNFWHEIDIPKFFALIYTPLLHKVFSSLILISAFWLLYNVVGISIAAMLTVSEAKGRRIDPNASSYIASGLKVLVAVFGVYFVLTKWGVDVSGLIAGLGIGGLAMALAAKDTAANLFSSIAIMLDKPFEIGDTIIVGTVRGKIMSLGLRSSRLEAPDGSIITYPNSILAAGIITDASKKQSSKVEMNISVAFSTTAEKLNEFMEEIRRIIKENENTTDSEPVVYFSTFSASALQLSISYETHPDFEREIEARQKINAAIIEAAEKMEIKLV